MSEREVGAETREFGFATRAVHAGARPEPHSGARATPIFQTTSYVFEDPEAAAAYFNLQEYGNTYSRIMNPTVAAFEERIANLEGGVGAVAFASGLAAQAGAFFTALQPGDHVVASRALYGGTLTQLKHLERKLGFGVTFVDPDEPDNWKEAVRPETRLFFGETIGNPGGNVLDIEAVAEIAHRHGVPLMVDSTFATPYLCRPLEWGADIVVHSTTKFIGGHGNSIGGVVVESGRFPWDNGKFPGIADPSPAYHGLAFQATFGEYGFLMKLRAETLRDLGACMSPFNAFLFGLGAETLPLRMERHTANALEVATFLRGRPEVETVAHPGLPGSRYAALVAKYLVRPEGRARGGSPVHSRAQPLFPSRERRRREEPGDPPGEHHPPATGRRRTPGRRDLAGHDPPFGRHRRPAGPDLGSDPRPGSRGNHARRRRGPNRGDHAMSSVIACELPPPLPADGSGPDLGQYQDAGTIRRLLTSARTVAVVGLSPKELRASYFVGFYLQRNGYRVVPVNPREKEILGEQCYPSVAAIEEPVDIVNVFRAPAAVPGIVEECAGRAKAIWLQYGVIHPEAAERARELGIEVVMDRCMKVEHARHLGRLHWLGFTTRRITARRPEAP